MSDVNTDNTTCERCHVETAKRYACRLADSYLYCPTCTSIIAQEKQSQIHTSLTEDLERISGALTDLYRMVLPHPETGPAEPAESIPTTPSIKITITLPFVRFDLERCDPRVHNYRVATGDRIRARSEMFWQDLVHQIGDVVMKIKGIHLPCDGNHREPPCSDPQCWCRKPQP
jgi:hypothetical protein